MKTTSIHQLPRGTNNGFEVTGIENGVPFKKVFPTSSEAFAFISEFIKNHS